MGESADTGVRVLQGAGASPARAPGPVRVAPRESEGGKERVASGKERVIAFGTRHPGVAPGAPAGLSCTGSQSRGRLLPRVSCVRAGPMMSMSRRSAHALWCAEAHTHNSCALRHPQLVCVESADGYARTTNTKRACRCARVHVFDPARRQTGRAGAGH